jgi:pSer/pThr/pTyr-binding forkhead associated (FHA) protein
MIMATLYQIGSNGSKAEVTGIDQEPVVVGRSAQAKVSVEDEGVSRRHFLVVREGEDYVIKDLSSRNGTWINGRRVFAGKLLHNDCILAGHTRFLFLDPSAASATRGEVQTGPHGTVMIPAAPQSERYPSDTGGQDFEAAA